MANDIIINVKDLQPKENNEDVYSDFSLPSLIRPIMSDKTESIIKMFFDTIHLGSIYEQLNQNEYILSFTEEGKAGLRTGKYTLDIRKDGSGLTPTARGENGFVEQGVVKKGTDSSALSQAMSNYAMYAMLQKISAQLEEIDQKVDIIREGQATDRIGNIIGAFRAYVIAYPTFLNEQEKRTASFEVYKTISQGLHQVHFELDTIAKYLDDAPTSYADIGLQLLNLFNFVADKKERLYHTLVYGLYKYYNMIKLSDIILLDRGANENVISRNHEAIESFCTRVLNKELDKKAKFLTGGNIKDYLDIQYNIYEYNDQIQKVLIPAYNEALNLEIKVDSATIKKIMNNGK
ncbi:MAG: hypothetical protein HXN87_08050 [Prevotella pallens]|uniref:hypothetical protein n=1 Tax=Prevotella pallens TaxID=60133 RepID=UPI001CB20225|nr:hypothetical protein [Prevotella pallens]MBF1519929.1 hypothetical protein [Prevotella pallens]